MAACFLLPTRAAGVDTWPMKGDRLDSRSVRAAGRKIKRTYPVILAVVCVLIIGAYGWSAGSGVWESWGRGAADSYYNQLVQGFRSGQLNLKREIPPGLAELTDPYDPAANRSYRLKGEYPVQDLSYYKGKLYLYFGVTPALLLFWPYTALTGSYLLHKDVVVFFARWVS